MPCPTPRRGSGRGRGRGGRNSCWRPSGGLGESLRRPAGPPRGQPTRGPSFSDLRGPPVWFTPAPLPSLERMRQAVLSREADARRRANSRREAGRQATAICSDLAEAQRCTLLSREAEHQSTEIRSSVKVVHSMRTPSHNDDLQLLRSLAAAGALESLPSPSPSVDSGSVK